MDRQKLKSWAKANGATGTVIFHAVIFLVLICCCMTSQMSTTEEGLAVSLGADDFGGSDVFHKADPAAVPDDSRRNYRKGGCECRKRHEKGCIPADGKAFHPVL